MTRDAIRSQPKPADQKPLPTGRNVLAVIGIDEYQQNLVFRKLTNAVSDAKGIRDLLVETFGFLEPVPHLFDAAATQPAITRLVTVQLKKELKPDDNLVLFFAGHGFTYESQIGEDKVETGYIIPVEAGADLDQYIKMNSFLEDVSLLPARHVLVILDACHSGFALGNAMQLHREGAVQYQANLVRNRSRRVVTSARRDERALDGGPVAGHSLFTGTLIDGLRNKKADLDGNGIVTSSELGLYLQQTVGQAAQARSSQQTPDFGSFNLDDRGEMAISYKLDDARDHFEVGRHLYELGWMLDDKGRFESAIRHFDKALELSPGPLPQARLERGRALLALGRYPEASPDLQAALQGDQDLSEASFLQGIAYAKQGENTRAAEALGAYARLHPDDSRALWIQDLVRRLSARPEHTQYALLIGIGHYANERLNLRGPENDVQVMHDLLVEQYGWLPGNIVQLLNERATRDGILRELDSLRQKATPSDTVSIYYSGHATSGDSLTYLVPYDTQQEPSGLKNTIDAQVLHVQVNRIPALSKTLIFDTHATVQFTRLAEGQANYTLFLATRPDQYAYEQTLDEKRTMGLFTFVLSSQLGQLPLNTSQGEILKKVVEGVQIINPRQTPLFFGRLDRPLFASESYEDWLRFFDFGQRQNFGALTLDELTRQYEDAQASLKVPFPELHYRFGRGFLEKGAHRRAVEALDTAAKQQEPPQPEVILALGIAQLRTQRYDDALRTFERYLQAVPADSDLMREPLELVGQLGQERKHALLVGINTYPAPSSVRGAENDVEALKAELTGRFGFQDADIKILTNKSATPQAILDAFRELVAQAQEEPALFYFAGAGTWGADGAPALVGCRGPRSYAGMLSLRALADITGRMSTNLVTILDAGWAREADLPWGPGWGSRFIPSAEAAARDITPPKRQVTKFATDPDPSMFLSAGMDERQWLQDRAHARAALQQFRIGRLSIYHVSLPSALGTASKLPGEAAVEAEFPALDGSRKQRIHGALTYYLIDSMRQAPDPTKLTYAEWTRAASSKLRWLQPYVLGENLDEKVFSNPLKEARTDTLISQRIFEDPIRVTASLLEHLIERQGEATPEDELDLGVVHAALGEYRTSIDALEAALDLRQGKDYPEAHYHLGRVLLEEGDKEKLNKAIDELSQAAKAVDAHPALVPVLASVYYYLGQAIRSQVERQAYVDAEKAFRSYLDKGAPIGRREEVQQFLDSRLGTGTGSGDSAPVLGSGTGTG